MSDWPADSFDFDDPHLDDLLTRWLTTELSDDEFAALHGRLQTDRVARKRLRQMALLDDVLQDMPTPAANPNPPRPAPTFSLWDFLGGPGATASLIAFSLCLVALGAWVLNGRISPREPANAPAEVVHTLAEGTSFQLDSGTAKMALPGVGSMVVDGPASVEFVNPLLARLYTGRVKVRVTEPTGIGFKLETPYGSVTDLGTEFGVNITDDRCADLVVYEGEVDLQVPRKNKNQDASYVERLEQGDGVRFGEGGRVDRIMSIITGPSGTFQKERDTRNLSGTQPVIVSVWDGRRASDTKKFYEIVPGGLREDALSYVDRRHEWNGLDGIGMPSYLIGADYVKTFCDDKIRTDVGVRVRLSCPAKLYVFFDERLVPPKWLKTQFKQTEDRIGMDLDAWHWPGAGRIPVRGDGPGASIDHAFGIWERVIDKPGTIQIGPNLNRADDRLSPYMYGIAAVALDPPAGTVADGELLRAAQPSSPAADH